MQKFFLRDKILRIDNFLEKRSSLAFFKTLSRSKTKLIFEPDSKRLEIVSSNSPLMLGVGSFLKNNFLLNQNTFSIQKFSHGSYTLLKKPDSQITSRRAFLFFSPQWNPSWGGTLHLLSQKKQVLLLPQQNTLFLVQRNSSTHFFIKYVSHFARKNCFFVVSW